MQVSHSGMSCLPGRIALAITPRMIPTTIAHSQFMSPPDAAGDARFLPVFDRSRYGACRTAPYSPCRTGIATHREAPVSNRMGARGNVEYVSKRGGPGRGPGGGEG